MNPKIKYVLGTLTLFSSLVLGSFIGYQSGKYNGIKQGREEVTSALRDQAEALYIEAKGSRDSVINQRAILESDTLNRAIRDLEGIALEAEEISK